MGKRQENRDKEDKIARLYSKRMLAPGAAAMKVQKQLSQELRIPPKTLRSSKKRGTTQVGLLLASPANAREWTNA